MSEAVPLLDPRGKDQGRVFFGCFLRPVEEGSTLWRPKKLLAGKGFWLTPPFPPLFKSRDCKNGPGTDGLPQRSDLAKIPGRTQYPGCRLCWSLSLG